MYSNGRIVPSSTNFLKSPNLEAVVRRSLPVLALHRDRRADLINQASPLLSRSAAQLPSLAYMSRSLLCVFCA